MDLVVIRTLFILVLTAACYFLRPFALEPWAAAVIGAIAAVAVIVFEQRVRALSIKRLLGAVLGSVLGIACRRVEPALYCSSSYSCS
jgi:Na+/H+ antiporter NhaD/arsenite permease-like protein